MHVDVVVVGSGPGGATVARQMAMHGQKVAIVEWGKDNPASGSIFSDPFRYFGGIKHRNRGFFETSSEPVMSMVRCITTGGSSMVFGGVSWDPPIERLKEYGVDINEEVQEIKNEITIKPLEQEQMGEAAKIISKSASQLGLKWKKIDRLFADSAKFKHESYLFGDKTGARWDARSWVIDAVNNGATLMNETLCKNIIVKDGKAIGIVANDKKNNEFNIFADTVVIAAGGIGSPVILKKSGIDKAGNNFFNDPYVVAIGYVDEKMAGKEVSRQEGLLMDGQFALGDMALPAQAYKQIVLKHSKKSKISRLMKRKRAVSIVVEIADDLKGSVDSECRVFKPLSSGDLDKLEKGKELAERILKNAGAKDIWFTELAGVHPGGTCKIGDIVDINLKTNIDNLYVSDASVLPESFAIPPVLTILALSLRLSKHLLGTL